MQRSDLTMLHSSEFRFRARGKLNAAVRRLLAWPLLGFSEKGPGSTIVRPRRIDGRDNIAIGRNAVILKYSWIQAISFYAGKAYTPRITIGDNFYAGTGLTIHTAASVQIGDDVILSSQVSLIGTEHPEVDGRVRMDAPLVEHGPIAIGSGCFIGAGAKILPGVALGQNCQVGANAVVARSFPAGSVIGGVPARLIRTLPDH